MTEASDRRTTSNEIAELTDKLRKRSTRAHFEARFYLFCAVVVGIGLIYYFTTSLGVFAKYGGIAIGGNVASSTIATKLDPGSIVPSVDWDMIVSSIVPRLGAVFIAIFIMQALISFSRYKFRLSDNLARAADICEGSGGNIENMQALSKIYLTDLGDISQFLQSPTDKVLELANNALAKIPKP